MAVFRNRGIRIAGMACAVPDNLVSARDYNAAFGADAVDRFVKSTGIERMYRALPDQTASDLAFAAAENMLESFDVPREQIGTLVFVTQSPDYRRPASACVLQERLGLPIECAAMDVGLGCSGFIYGLEVARGLLSSSDSRFALLLLGETASKLVDPMDRSIAMMYGDAGAAILLERAGEEKALTLLQTDGGRYRSIILPAGGFRDMNPPHDSFQCSDGIERTLYDIFMDGTAVFSFSITDVPEALDKYLELTQTTVDDYDVFAFHQANQFIIRQLIRKLRLNKGAVPLSLSNYGNTGGVSIPLTLCDSFAEEGDAILNVLACGFGIGLSWGVTSFQIDTQTLCPIAKTSDYYAEGKLGPGTY